MDPPPELSWRTRREIKFTRTLGLPTFSNAFLQYSGFKIFSIIPELSRVIAYWINTMKNSGFLKSHFTHCPLRYPAKGQFISKPLHIRQMGIITGLQKARH
jgi:hypothetical protein